LRKLVIKHGYFLSLEQTIDEWMNAGVLISDDRIERR